jgi:glycyl-tRNA synthetase (class II)
MTIGKAIKDGVVDNETLGYFLARISLFLEKIGVDMKKLRFRQHMVSASRRYVHQSSWQANTVNRRMKWYVWLRLGVTDGEKVTFTNRNHSRLITPATAGMLSF